MSESCFASSFIESTGLDLGRCPGERLIERARRGKLMAILSHHDIALMMLGDDYMKNYAYLRVITDEIESACRSRVIKSHKEKGHPGQAVAVTRLGSFGDRIETVGKTTDLYFIHRDEFRRYLQSLDCMPEEGSPLWCWLRKKPDDGSVKLKPEQQDKADFQQLCKEHWSVSPLTKIRGHDGVVDQLGKSYVRAWTENTVIRWATEVAPPEVSGRRGRPRKKPS